MQNCSVCIHPDIENINKSLASGTSLRDIANQAGHDGLTKSSLARHRKHLTVKLAKVAERKEMGKVVRLADDIVEQVKDLNARVSNILAACEADGDRRNAIAAIREARGLLETQAKLMGNFAPTTAVQVNVNTPSLRESPEWGVLVAVLGRHPEIRLELDQALMGAGL